MNHRSEEAIKRVRVISGYLSACSSSGERNLTASQWKEIARMARDLDRYAKHQERNSQEVAT